MMALAVNVGGERAAQRDELGARRDRREKAARQEHLYDLGDRDPGFAAQDAGFRIEGEHPVEPLQIDHPVVIVDRGVAIGAAASARNQIGGIGCDHGCQLGKLLGTIDLRAGHRIAAPSGELHLARLRRAACARELAGWSVWLCRWLIHGSNRVSNRNRKRALIEASREGWCASGALFADYHPEREPAPSIGPNQRALGFLDVG